MYRKSVLLVPRISCSRDENAISKSRVMDGIFPLSTNANLDASAVLRAYKYQPALEKRHALLKTGLQVASVQEFIGKVEAPLMGKIRASLLPAFRAVPIHPMACLHNQ
jgi:hypothetical protein